LTFLRIQPKPDSTAFVEDMEILPLAPLPIDDSAAARGYRRVQNEGFVDEAVVLSMIARGAYERVYVQPEEMVLSSSEEDYAGWALPVASPFRSMMHWEKTMAAAAAPVKVPAAPSLDGIRKLAEPGLAEPYRGTHRWWLFGATGALSCGLLSLTLLSLALRLEVERPTAAPTPVSPKAEVESLLPTHEIQTALTSILSSAR
jgi:hypothetical protein